MNKIRECPLYPHIVVTHTDAKELYVWDVEKQPNRADAKVLALLWLCSIWSVFGDAGEAAPAAQTGEHADVRAAYFLCANDCKQAVV